MVIPSLLIKGALVVAGAGIVSSATVGTIVTYQKSMLGSSQEEMEGLEKKCYVILADTTEDNSQKKLLLCVPTYQYMFQLGREVKGKDEKSSIAEIKKKGDQLIISWQEWGGNSSRGHGLSNKDTELKINGNEWGNIKEDVNLTVSCHFVPDTAKNGEAKWQCSGSVVTSSDKVAFQLTPFEGEITSLNGKEN